jgi:hypothetical protein
VQHWKWRREVSLLRPADFDVVARQVGLSNRAMELFDWLRGLEPSHDLAALCDVYTCAPQNPVLSLIQLVLSQCAPPPSC